LIKRNINSLSLKYEMKGKIKKKKMCCMERNCNFKLIVNEF